MRGLVLKELGKWRICNLAECTKINFIRIMQAIIQIPPASVRHFRASLGLLHVVVSQMLVGNLYTTLPFFLFVCVIGSWRVCSNVFPRLSQESALCAKSPGVQHTPTDDPDMIPETVSPPPPSHAALQSGTGSWVLV